MRKHFTVALLYAILQFVSVVALAESEASVATLKDSVARAVQIFSQKDYAQAYEAFKDLDATFGDEPEYDVALKKILWPLWGYASLMNNRPEEAVEIFENYLQAYPEQNKQKKFILFNLAQALQRADLYEKALAAYQNFIELYPQTPEASISIIRQAELYFKQNEEATGIEHLLQFSGNEQFAESLRSQAKLRALQKAQESGSEDKALEILFSHDWTITEMPELAILTFSAMQIGDYAFAQKRFHDAIRAYRLVPPRRHLIRAQERRLLEIERILEERSKRTLAFDQSNRIWDVHYQQVLKRGKQQLDALKNAEDYTPSFHIRLGQAFLLSGRHYEAFILFQSLANDTTLDTDTRAEAHYRWTLSANVLEDWDQAHAIAQEFVDTYPEHELAPQTLYLITNIYQQQKDYAAATALLTQLIEKYPEHSLVPRWHFSIGLNRAFQTEYTASREAFETLIEQFSTVPLAKNAQLWIGLTYFFEKSYPVALEVYGALLKEMPEKHPLYPEVEYQILKVRYSQRDLKEANKLCHAFLNKYPGHAKYYEALTLRGDIYMAMGLLEKAIEVFKQIPTDMVSLYTYANFQIGKILKALEDYSELATHFQDYLNNEKNTAQARLAEALYWIGWAYEKQDQAELAIPTFLEAIETHGNDPEAGELQSILKALQRLHKNNFDSWAQANEATTDMGGLQNHQFFSDWVEAEQAEALANKQLTLYARYSLYLAQLYRQQKNENLSDVTLLKIIEHVPNELLDTECLVKVGSVLLAMQMPSARQYFEDCLDRTPRTPQKGEALFGLAQIEAEANEYATALQWLNRFQAEVPHHSMAIQATLLQAEILIELESYESAIARLTPLLKLKAARGRPQAQAIFLLARVHHADKDYKKAVGYYQRIFTTYRAYTKLVAESYLKSAECLVELDDIQAAYETLSELISDVEYANADSTEKAKQLFSELGKQLEAMSLSETERNP